MYENVYLASRFFVVLIFILAGLLVPLYTLAEEATSTPEIEEEEIVEDITPTPVHDREAVEARVREVFADASVMIEVARCESTFRQFADSGNVFRGGFGAQMLGVFQINESVHITKSQELGFDVTTLEGNLSYARYLYDQSGTDPWISSFQCWNTNDNEENDTSSSESGLLTSDLSLGMINDEVRTLQELLNKLGFTLAVSGPGSPGNETRKFGALTRAAVRKFQCAKDIACSGDEFTTGYGFVNAKTRTVLLEAVEKGEVITSQDENTDEEEDTVAVQEEKKSEPQSVGVNAKELAEIQAQISVLLALVLELQEQLLQLLARQS